jgi:hypothetical protein
MAAYPPLPAIIMTFSNGEMVSNGFPSVYHAISNAINESNGSCEVNSRPLFPSSAVNDRCDAGTREGKYKPEQGLAY